MRIKRWIWGFRARSTKDNFFFAALPKQSSGDLEQTKLKVGEEEEGTPFFGPRWQLSLKRGKEEERREETEEETFNFPKTPSLFSENKGPSLSCSDGRQRQKFPSPSFLIPKSSVYFPLFNFERRCGKPRCCQQDFR